MAPSSTTRAAQFIARAALLLAVVLGFHAPVHAQTDDALPALIELLDQTEDAQFQLDLLKGMSDGLKGRRHVPKPAPWDKVAEKLSRSPNTQVQELTRTLSLTFGSANAMTDLRRQLQDPSAATEVRQRALASLLEAKDAQLPALLHALLNEPSMRSHALRGLAAYDDPRTPPAILDVYPKLSVAERRDALNTLVSRAAFAVKLLDGVRQSIVPRKDLTADIIRQLRQWKDPKLNEQVEKLWGTARESGADKLQQIAQFKAKLQTAPAGEPHRGRAVFARICQQCHTLFDVGGKVGPDLTGSNRADLDYVLHNILDPNAEIPNDYRSSTVETKDDRILTGILTRQDDTAVVIVTANDTVLLPRAEVRGIQQNQLSMMPEGLAEALTTADLADLIAYLKSPAQVPMAAAEEHAGLESNPAMERKKP